MDKKIQSTLSTIMSHYLDNEVTIEEVTMYDSLKDTERLDLTISMPNYNPINIYITKDTVFLFISYQINKNVDRIKLKNYLDSIKNEVFFTVNFNEEKYRRISELYLIKESTLDAFNNDLLDKIDYYYYKDRKMFDYLKYLVE